MVQRPLGNHLDGPDTLLVTSDTTQPGTDTDKSTSTSTSRSTGTDTGDATGTDTGTGTGADTGSPLADLVARAKVVLWDFDGPICRLFAQHSARLVADDLVRWLARQGLHGLLTEDERTSVDPHFVLRAVDHRHPGSDLVTELEERLTKEEHKAAASAMPTPYADPLIRTWTALGSRMAITTNNSPLVVHEYLAGRGLLSCFAPHLYGRTRDLHRLKPDPHCLNRALNTMGSAPENALMIGDTPTDCAAAKKAGVRFLGYARNAYKEKRLRDAGATDVVGSLKPLLEAVRAAATPRP
ncbi:HAD-IA family hydrolase [Streptomyces sp. NPDC047000]|uniref:HAD family hydrolase n=1 Tax=Streptomyces sp. NPDC047000 TaxID=3155474 RepID=UPI0033DFA700